MFVRMSLICLFCVFIKHRDRFNYVCLFVKCSQVLILVLQAELNDLRMKVIALLDNNSEVSPIISRLTFAQCTYILSVFRMETLRYGLQLSTLFNRNFNIHYISHVTFDKLKVDLGFMYLNTVCVGHLRLTI